MKTIQFQILIDTKEQKPYRIPGAMFQALDTGDYTLAGLEHQFAIERKTLSDFYGSITKGHARFRKEIKRAQGFLDFVILVEAEPGNLIDTWSNGRQIHPNSVRGVIKKWREEYGIRWVFVRTAKQGKKFVEWQLKQWHEEYQAGLWQEQEVA